MQKIMRQRTVKQLEYAKTVGIWGETVICIK